MSIIFSAATNISTLSSIAPRSLSNRHKYSESYAKLCCPIRNWSLKSRTLSCTNSLVSDVDSRDKFPKVGARSTGPIASNHLIEVVKTAAQTGAQVVMDAVNKPRNITYKGLTDLVTETDKMSEAAILEVVKKNFDNHLILGEEGGIIGEAASDYLWCIDPLDGTTNFAHGYPSFAVSVGVLYRGNPAAAAVVEFVGGPMCWNTRIFSATAGGGAFCNGQRIQVSATNQVEQSLLVTGFGYDHDDAWATNIDLFKEFTDVSRGVRRLGAAAVDMCHVALGIVEAYWEYRLKPWDMAAGVLMVEEAGGTVSRMDGGKFCVFDRSVLVSNGILHSKDRSSGRMIGTGCESHGLYQLYNSTHACAVVDSPLMVHAQLGHPSLQKLQQLVPSLSKLSTLSCESCGKHTRSSFPSRVNNRAKSSFVLVHSDVWGPSRTVSTLGSRYFVTFIDDYSRCTWLFLMKNRSELFSIFQTFYHEIKSQFGVQICKLQSDNAQEYLSQPFQKFMASHGILHQTSCAYTPQQNGVAERKNRHLIETTRTLLLHGHVPQRFWADAVLTACYLINRMPSSVLDNKIPHSILFPNQSLHTLPPHIFGSTCFVHNLSPGLDKFSARSLKCVFLGYSRSQKGYRCYSPTLHRYLVSVDVTFFESVPFFGSMSSEPTSSLSEPMSSAPEVGILPPSQTPEQINVPNRPLQVYQRRQSHVHETMPAVATDTTDSTPAPITPLPSVLSPESDLPIALRKGIRSTRNPSPHYVTLSYHRLSPLHYACISSLSSVSIPKTVGEALSHPGWKQAMIEEMCALQNSGTWDLVPLPSGKSVVGCRWIFTVKVGPDGKVDRLKARLVAKGYTQVFGLDYGDTFSPVAKMTSVRLLLSLAAIRHWPLYQLDIKNAFLHGDLVEEVYMEQPPGFVAQGESSGLVCRLRKSLYGLKQSPRAWFGRFSTVVQQFGMIRSEVDHSVFYRNSAQGCIYLIVYVDDIVITGSDHHGIHQVKQHLHQHFQTKDLGKLRYFLGIEVAQSKDGTVISQRKYAMDILDETSLLNAKSVDTPMDPNVKLMPNQGETLQDPERYRRLVGKLNYLTVTRPDISFAVSVVSQFLNSPCAGHWDAVMRILKYIKGNPGKGLIYEDKGHTQVIGYSDADWAGSPTDRRSTSGYCVFVGGNLISWKSKKQSVVARSSAEAEYRAMASATCELIWLKQLLQELRFGKTTQMTLICDNQAALHIASNPVFHERTKHIEIDCHFIREKIISGDIITRFVNSNDQIADIFTKSLRGPRIDFICNKLGTYDIYAPA